MYHFRKCISVPGFWTGSDVLYLERHYAVGLPKFHPGTPVARTTNYFCSHQSMIYWRSACGIGCFCIQPCDETQAHLFFPRAPQRAARMTLLASCNSKRSLRAHVRVDELLSQLRHSRGAGSARFPGHGSVGIKRILTKKDESCLTLREWFSFEVTRFDSDFSRTEPPCTRCLNESAHVVPGSDWNIDSCPLRIKVRVGAKTREISFSEPKSLSVDVRPQSWSNTIFPRA